MASETIQYDTVAKFVGDLPGVNCPRCNVPFESSDMVGLALGNMWIHLHCRRDYRDVDSTN